MAVRVRRRWLVELDGCVFAYLRPPRNPSVAYCRLSYKDCMSESMMKCVLHCTAHVSNPDYTDTMPIHRASMGRYIHGPPGPVPHILRRVTTTTTSFTITIHLRHFLLDMFLL